MLLISIANTQIEIEHAKQKYRPPLPIEPFAKAGLMRGQLRWNCGYLGVLILLQQKQNTRDSADRISTVTDPNQSSQKVTRKKQVDKLAEA